MVLSKLDTIWNDAVVVILSMAAEFRRTISFVFGTTCALRFFGGRFAASEVDLLTFFEALILDSSF